MSGSGDVQILLGDLLDHHGVALVDIACGAGGGGHHLSLGRDVQGDGVNTAVRTGQSVYCGDLQIGLSIEDNLLASKFGLSFL